MPVQTPDAVYDRWKATWRKLRDCVAGSDAVKAAQTDYLPALAPGDLTQKTRNRYDAYLRRALFFNATRRTVGGLVGAIHQKPPKTEFHNQNILDAMTPSGHSFGMLAHEVTHELMVTGRLGVLVDMATEGGERPYAAIYPTESIISWRVEVRGDREVLTRVVMTEEDVMDDPEDEWVRVSQPRIRVCQLTGNGYEQSIWKPRKDKADEYELVSGPRLIMRAEKPLDFIPFGFFAPTRNSAMVEAPPLNDLADVNLSHYRGYADHKHGLHFTALPTVVFMSDKNMEDVIGLGSGEAIQLAKGDEATMLEFRGQGLAAIEKDLDKMERLMAVLGARLLEEQPRTQETLGAVTLRHSGEYATLRTITRSVEAAGRPSSV